MIQEQSGGQVLIFDVICCLWQLRVNYRLAEAVGQAANIKAGLGL